MDVKDRLLQFIKQTNLTTKEFELLCGMSNGYIASMRKGLGPQKLNNVLSRFPELNREWLLFGEGEMTKNNQTIGDISNSKVCGVNVSGDGIHIDSDNYATLLKIVEANQRSTEKFQEQIDRLLTIIEHKYGTENR